MSVLICLCLGLGTAVADLSSRPGFSVQAVR